jgi:hypothetical protein
MAGEDDVPDETSLRRRATRRLLDLGARGLTRARLGAEGPGEVAADLLLMESQHSVYVQLHRRWTERGAARRRGPAQRARGAGRDVGHGAAAPGGGADGVVDAVEPAADGHGPAGPGSTSRARSSWRTRSAHVFATDLGQLALPPERLAVLVRGAWPCKPGIVGLPNVGKSTLFNALTAAGAESANYPFCTIEPNVGIVPVPDPRLEQIQSGHLDAEADPGLGRDRRHRGPGARRQQGRGPGQPVPGPHPQRGRHPARGPLLRGRDVVHVDGGVNPLRDIETIERGADPRRHGQSPEKRSTSTASRPRAATRRPCKQRDRGATSW